MNQATWLPPDAVVAGVPRSFRREVSPERCPPGRSGPASVELRCNALISA